MPENEPPMDVRAAADLLRQTERDTRAALTVPTAPINAAWGVAWLVGLGVMWLSVRDQHPYQGPTTPAAVLLGVLILAAIAATMVVVIRATKGVGGASDTQGRMYGWAWPIGFGTLFTIEGALGQVGASAEVLGLLGATGPLLVTSLIQIGGAAIWLDRPMFVLGAWLALVAAVGVWTGPVAVLAVEAVAGGGGFLVAAALSARRNRT
jgi:hypothetical protein